MNKTYAFIEAAYAAVQALTDEGDQMHRRAVRGKRLVVHLHGWDATANERPAPGGMAELCGGRAVSLRVAGQSVDVGCREMFTTSASADRFAADVTSALATLPPPVPGDPRGGTGRGQGRKPADGKRGSRRNVILDDASTDTLRNYGNGDLSLGIRKAAARLTTDTGAK